jgi:transglutaminase-like putative cysteine protease
MFLAIRHTTSYSYSQPVFLEPHVIRLSPRADAYRRLMERTLTVIPEPDGASQGLDANGSLSHLVWFKRKTSSLTILSKIVLELNEANPFGFIVYPSDCLSLPIRYPQQMLRQLTPYMTSEAIPASVREYALKAMQESHHNVVEFALLLSKVIAQDCVYQERKTGEPFTSEKVLLTRNGSCRDLAVLYIDAARAAGLAARFVSGYYFDHSPKHPQLHAWAEVYIPGGGWRGYDPTLGLACYGHHIALASGAVPIEAAAVDGKFFGDSPSIMDVKMEYEYLKQLSKPVEFS